MSHLLNVCLLYFFFHQPAPTATYTLSLHDALPICAPRHAVTVPATMKRLTRALVVGWMALGVAGRADVARADEQNFVTRSEEHTSELQSQSNLVCRLLLEKKK